MPVLQKAPSSAQQTARISKPLSSSMKHHQTVYDDGRNRYVVERSRRSKAVPGAEATNIESSSYPSVLKVNGVTPSKHLPSSKPRSFPSPKTSSRDEQLVSRDDIAKESRTSRAVVITSALPRPIVTTIEKCSSASQTCVEPTPPATPRLRRLSSPEIPDLDMAPFCACDEAKFVVYCTACKKEGDCRSSWY